MNTSADTNNPTKGIRAFLFLIPAMVGMVIYAGSLGHGFVLDDNLVLTSNAHVQEGFSGIGKLMRNNYAHGHSGFNDGLYRPLSLVTFAAEKSLFDLNPGASHFIQILLYGLLLLLLFLWLDKLFPEQKMLVFWIAMLYAVHPIHTEVVANLKGRDDLLAMLFFAGSASAFLSWLKDQQLKHIIVAMLCALGAAFSKESAVTFIAIFPLMAWYKSASIRQLFTGTSLMATPFALFLLVRYSILSSLEEVDSGVSSLLQNPLFESDGFAERLVTSAKIQALYFEKLFFPINLSHDYSFNAIPVVGFSDIQGLIWLGVLMLMLAVGIMGLKNRSRVGLGIMFYFITISVVANFFILIGAMAAERFVFTPSLGWCIAVVFGLTLLAKRFKPLAKQYSIDAILMGLCLVLGVLTVNRVPDWESNFSLFTADVDKVPESARAHYNAGSAMNDEARTNPREASKLVEGARKHLKQAIKIWPEYQDAYNNLGISYMNSKEFDAAYTVFEEFIELYPSYSKARYNMAATCHKLKKYDEAETHYEFYIEHNPGLADALFFVAECEGFQNKFSEAIDHLNQLVALEPNRSRGHLKLGMAYAMSGMNAEAEKALLRSTALDPNNVDAQFNLAVFYATTNNLEKAGEILRLCLKINPGYTRAQELLGQLNATP